VTENKCVKDYPELERVDAHITKRRMTMAQQYLIRGLKDVEEVEKIPYSERAVEKSTIEMLEKGAGIDPDATAISFILNGDSYESPIDIPYSRLIGRIRQTANMFHDLGVRAFRCSDICSSQPAANAFRTMGERKPQGLPTR
jgi:hypothetical protein